MTKEDLEKIFTYDIPFEMIEDIDKNVENNINIFIKNSNIQYAKNIKIVFLNRYNSLSDPKYYRNACARKDSLGTYQIYICPQLITDLFRFAHFIAGFKGFRLDESEENRQTFAQHLMYFWLYFISLHEYAHIIHGHVDYNIASKANTHLYEFIDLSSLNDEELVISQAMELQADSTAGALFFSSLIESKKNIQGMYFCDYSDQDLVFDYLLGLNFLFHYFEVMSGGKINGTHPLSKERVTFFNGSILYNKEKLNKLFKIKEINIEHLSGLAYIEYMKFNKISEKEEVVGNLIKFLQKMKFFDEKKVLDLFEEYRLL